MAPKFDIEQLIRDLKNFLPMQIAFEWVKSHQDTTENGKPIYGPFPRNIQLNYEVDKLVARGLKLPPPQRAVYTHTIAALYDSNGRLVADIPQFLYKWINSLKTREYIGRKFN